MTPDSTQYLDEIEKQLASGVGMSKSDLERVLIDSFVVIGYSLERLEQSGKICRDESLCGLIFYRNRF